MPVPNKAQTGACNSAQVTKTTLATAKIATMGCSTRRWPKWSARRARRGADTA